MERLRSVRRKLVAVFAMALIACMLVPATALALDRTWTLEYLPGTTDKVQGMPASQSYTSTNPGVQDFYCTFPVSKAVPTRDYYTFGGWTDGVHIYGYASGQNQFVRIDASGVVWDFSGNKHDYGLTATWIPDSSYTITYTDGVDGEELFADQVYTDVTPGSETPAFEGVPSRKGHVFTGWSPEVSELAKGDAIYKAQWEEVGIMLTITPGANSTVTGVKVKAGDTIPGEGDVPDRTIIYVDESTGEIQVSLGSFSMGGYPVKLPAASDLWEGVVEGSTDVILCEPMPPWLSTEFEEGDPVAYVKPDTSNTAIYNFKETYAVTYTDGVDGEEVFADQTSHVLPNAATPAFDGTPTRDGYVFDGWAPAVAETVTGDVTYVAQWKKTYTVTYTDGANGEAFVDEIHSAIPEGSATPAFEGGTPTLAGSEFIGWAPAVAETVTGDVTYVAQWTHPCDFKVVFDANGGTGAPETLEKLQITDKTCDFEIPSTAPTRHGYDFGGWALDSKAAASSYAAGDTVTLDAPTDPTVSEASLTLYAFWTRNDSEVYNLWIEGIQITDENLEGTLGDGSYAFDPSTSTLTLTDAAIEYSGEDAIYSELDSLTVVLEGENSITGFSGTGIKAKKSGCLTIEGEGSLSIDSADGAYGLYASGDIDITGTTLKIDSVGLGVYSGNGDVTISGSELKLGIGSKLGEDALGAYYDVTIEESDVEIICEGYGIYADYGDLAIDSSSIAIDAAEDDGLYGYYDVTIEASDVEMTCGDDGIYADYGNVSIGNSDIRIACADDALYGYYDVDIEGSDVEIACGDDGIYTDDNCSVTGSSISIDAGYYGFYIYHDLSVDSSDVVVTSVCEALYLDNLTVTNGSYVELESTGDDAIELYPSNDGGLMVDHSVLIAQSLGGSYCGIWNGDSGCPIDDHLSLSDELIIRTGATLDEVEATDTVGTAAVVVIAPGTFTVTFDSQGGSKVAAQELGLADTVTQPDDPTRKGYTFDGWFTDADCTEAYDFSQPVRRDMTLFAKWTQVKPDPDDPDEPEPDDPDVPDPDDPDNPDNPTNPDTGDSALPLVMIGALTLAGICLLLVRRRVNE